MQSNGARALVALGSVAAIVVLLIAFAGGDDDQDGGGTTALETTAPVETDGGSSGSGKPAKAEKPEKPEFARITVVNGQPKGGVSDLTYSKGDEVRLEVASDIPEEVHVHGYDITKDVEAGGKVKLRFAAEIDGIFEVELEGSAVQIAQLTVKP
jgi:hypothetical protein